jgi:hypothetical protein
LGFGRLLTIEGGQAGDLELGGVVEVEGGTVDGEIKSPFKFFICQGELWQIFRG